MSTLRRKFFSPFGSFLVWRSYALFFVTLLPLCQVWADTSAPTSNSVPARLKEAVVIGSGTSLHDVESESDLVGPANQPEWTARRVFAETDVYVIPSGEIEFDQFYISSHPREGKHENLFESEIAIGLPWRTQFDVEMNYEVTGGSVRYNSTFLELPHALADWGKIPLNPAINFGWRFNNDESDAYILRLLLADQFGERLHFGSNLSFEQQIGGPGEREYELTAALSYVAIDRRLAIGAELVVEYEEGGGELDEEDNASKYSTTVLLGPSVLFRPSKNTHLSFVPLVGLTGDSPWVEAFLVFGIDFEPFRRGGGSESENDRVQPIRRLR